MEGNDIKNQTNNSSRKHSGAIAAFLVFIIIIFVSLLFIFNRNGSRGPGHDDSTTFMCYAGPVFPLTLSADNNDITAKRNIDYNFANFVGNTILIPTENLSPDQDNSYESWDSTIDVTDSYTLTNNSFSDQTVTMLYPFVGSFSSKDWPVITVNSNEIEMALYAGVYTGGFESVLGSSSGGSVNLDSISSWEEYKSLLESGEYIADTYSLYPESNQPVTVYAFSNSDAHGSEASNPSLAVEMKIDYNKTTVLSYGFHGSERNAETGYLQESYSIEKPDEYPYPEPKTRYLIFLGDVPDDYKIQGYQDMGCNKGEEIDVTVDVSRYETTLDIILKQLIMQYDSEIMQYDNELFNRAVPIDLFYREVCRTLHEYGPLAEITKERYNTGWLYDIISDTADYERVLYLTAEVTIPAGGSTTIEADMKKGASFDYHCSNTVNQGIYSYDMVTKLGSNLIFSNLSASIKNHDMVEIIRQNLGFDLEKGITTATLSPAIEHYYLEVKRVTAGE